MIKYNRYGDTSHTHIYDLLIYIYAYTNKSCITIMTYNAISYMQVCNISTSDDGGLQTRVSRTQMRRAVRRLMYGEQLFVHTRAVINEKTSGTLSGIRVVQYICPSARACVWRAAGARGRRRRRPVQCGRGTSKFRLDTRRAEHRTRRDFPARWF